MIPAKSVRAVLPTGSTARTDELLARCAAHEWAVEGEYCLFPSSRGSQGLSQRA